MKIRIPRREALSCRQLWYPRLEMHETWGTHGFGGACHRRQRPGLPANEVFRGWPTFEPTCQIWVPHVSRFSDWEILKMKIRIAAA
jgi:hypothetical protein